MRPLPTTGVRETIEGAACCPFYPNRCVVPPGYSTAPRRLLSGSGNLRRSSRSHHSNRSSTLDRNRPSCRNLSSTLPSQHTPHISHPGSSRRQRLPACQGWTRSTRVHCCNDEACRWRSHSQYRCSYIPLCFGPESRPRSAHRLRQPGGATCRGGFAVSPTNGPPHRTAVHPWPDLLSRVDWPYAPRVDARYREFASVAIPSRGGCFRELAG